MDQMVKSTTSVMHKMVLMKDRIRQLEEANRIISKRRKAKRSRIQAGGSLELQTAKEILGERDVEKQLAEEIRVARGRRERAEPAQRCCSTCGKNGHNKRTCRADVGICELYCSG